MSTMDFDEQLNEILQTIAEKGMVNAARGFAGLVGHKIEVTEPNIRLIPLFDIPNIVGGTENEAVGIYLRFEGDITGQIIMIISFEKAMELVDLILDIPNGTTNQLGSLERSALGEIGNLTGSFFLNSVANITGYSVRPSPPAVIVDMVGAILDIIIASSGGVSDQALLLEADFVDGNRSTKTNFWVIPDPTTFKGLKDRK